MVGMTRQDVIDTINKLNKTKYVAIFNSGTQRLMGQYSGRTLAEKFFEFYQDEVLIPIVADLIEANNQKITEDLDRVYEQFKDRLSYDLNNAIRGGL